MQSCLSSHFHTATAASNLLTSPSSRLIRFQPQTKKPTHPILRQAALVEGPPSDFNLRESSQLTQAHVKAKYPDLLDLVEDGSLMVHLRPKDYVEPRDDGFEEPMEVFVLGTSHYSEKSAADAVRVIRSVHPENVVVELCRSRTGMLADVPQEDQASIGNPMSLGGDNFVDAVLRAVSLGGATSLALRLVLGILSKRLTKGFDFDGGAEMRASVKEAQDIGAQIVLGDRPIEITLDRTWKAMKLSSRWKAFSSVVQGLSLSEDAIIQNTKEAKAYLKDLNEDVIDIWMEKLLKEFPEIGPSLVHERDMYLAWSLKRSKAVKGCSRVVGVVGRAHLKGVIYALSTSPGQLRFKDLVGDKSRLKKMSKAQAASRFIQRLIFEVSIAFACYYAWVEWTK